MRKIERLIASQHRKQCGCKCIKDEYDPGYRSHTTCAEAEFRQPYSAQITTTRTRFGFVFFSRRNPSLRWYFDFCMIFYINPLQRRTTTKTTAIITMQICFSNFLLALLLPLLLLGVVGTHNIRAVYNIDSVFTVRISSMSQSNTSTSSFVRLGYPICRFRRFVCNDNNI